LQRPMGSAVNEIDAAQVVDQRVDGRGWSHGAIFTFLPRGKKP
jgi:hypothetical protein